MNNFEEIVTSLEKEKIDDIDEFLLEVFSKKNLKDYQIDKDLDSDQKKAIKLMFESKKKLIERVDSAFKYDPLCIEALFVYLLISEDTFVSMRFETYYKQANYYVDFNDYEKKCYIRILNFYVDFLLDIKNITSAIKVQKLIIKLTNNADGKIINRLSHMYFLIENVDEFYKLYANYEFDAYDYILLIVTELKHDNTMIAEQILLDMFDKIEYSNYLDHMWDLDENDPKQKDFSMAVEDSFSSVLAIPTFFSFVNEVREKYNK